MARAISDIYNALVIEKQSQAQLTALTPSAGENAANLLAALTSGSMVAIWRLFLWVYAVGLWVHENIFDQHVIEVQNIANTLITGTVQWYQQQALLFQLGDTLTWQNITFNIGNNIIVLGVRFFYAIVNPANQIIKRAAVIEFNNATRLLTVKVAKLDIGNNPIPLSTPEYTAFSAYMNLIKFAGTNLTVISQNPDLLKLFATIVYDPLVLDNTGQSLITAGVYPVSDAITAFIGALPFNGTLYLDDLVKAIRAVPGVIHASISDAEGAETLYGFNPIDPALGYNAVAGYMIVDPANPLSATLTYETL